MHPTDFEILALLHGEQVPAEVHTHLASCPICALRRNTLLRGEATQNALVRELDLPVPAVPAELIRHRAIARRRVYRMAASIGILAILASTAMALPGMPVWNWLRGDRPDPALINPTRVPIARHRPAATADGIAITPNDVLVIELRHSQSSGQIRIIRTDAPVASLRAAGGRVDYRIAPGRVTLENRQPAERYEISLPRTLRRVTLLVGGQVFWQLDQSSASAGPDTLILDLTPKSGEAP